MQTFGMAPRVVAQLHTLLHVVAWPHSLYESMPCSIFCIYPLVNNLSSQAWSESYTLVINGVSPARGCWVLVAA